MLGTFLEGETAILAASSLIREGIFEGPYIVFFAFAGSFISDWLYFAIGKFNGLYFISTRPKLKAKFEPVQNFFIKHQLQVLLSYRFLYGFRVIIPLLVGMSGIRPIRYLFFSILSGVLWASVVSTLGYGLGVFFQITTKSFEENLLVIMLALGSFGTLIGWTVNRVVSKKISGAGAGKPESR